MTTTYFFSHANLEQGLFSGLQMQEMAANGCIVPTHLVWRAGTVFKALASRDQYLFATIAHPLLTPAAAASAEIAAPACDNLAAPAETAPEIADATSPIAEKPTIKAELPPRPRRVVSLRGAILSGQDDTDVKFKKKRPNCRSEEPTRRSAVIRVGTLRVPLYCRTCRKGRVAEITGAN